MFKKALQYALVLGLSLGSGSLFASMSEHGGSGSEKAGSVAEKSGSTALYKVDPAHSYIGFEIAHLVVSKTRGQFKDYSIDLHFDEKNPENSKVKVEIKAESIDTKIEKRDNHLRSGDFFDVKNHPTITFKSTKIKKKDKNKYEVTGKLTMRGKTREITFPATYRGKVTGPYGKERIGFEASLTIDRRDYNIAWTKKSKTGELVAGFDVDITIDFEAIKQ